MARIGQAEDMLERVSAAAELPGLHGDRYRMRMPRDTHIWTREEVLALPEDGKRYELIDGELLVSPSPSWPHQWAVGALYRRVYRYLESNRVGLVTFSPADLDLKSGQLSQPDLFVAPPVGEGRTPRDWKECGIPILVVEVLSPSTARYDRITKRLRYQRSGVGEYWIVDQDALVIERWRPGDERPEILDTTITWCPPGATEGLTINLAEYFREANEGI